MADPAVAVVIVTWNSAAVVGGCLRSLAGATAEAVEVVVVDNASHDATLAEVHAAAPDAQVIANATNRGLAAANNQGIAATTAPLVLLSNPDVRYGPGSVDALVDLLRRRPRAAFAIPRLVRPDGTLQTAVGDLPTLRSALLGRQWHHRRAATTGLWWDGWDHAEERAAGHGMEAAYLVRRAAIDEIGPQDEGFRLDWEGIDWSARARDAGWEIWFSPDAEVVHLGGASLRQAQARWIARSHRGMYRYFAKRSRPAARPVLAALFAGRGAAKLVGARLGLADYDAGNPGSATPWT